MSEQAARRQELLSIFGAEVEERMRALNRLLLELERDEGGEPQRSETLAALFREAHSLKGAARAVELGHMEQLAHALESGLDRLRQGGGKPSGDWFDRAFGAIDAFGSLHRLALEGQEEMPREVSELIVKLESDAPSPAAKPETSTTPHPAKAVVAPEPAEESGRLDALPVRAGHPKGPPVRTPQTPVAAPVAQSEAVARVSQESVRVAVAKLDALLAQAGELAVTDIRIERRRSELVDLRQELDNWRREWRSTRALRTGLRRAVDSRGYLDAGLARDLSGLLVFAERVEQRVQSALERVEEIAGQLRQDTAQLAFVTHAIADEVMAVRLLPVQTIFAPFERMVRDLTRSQHKEVHLVIEGEGIEIDRKILEQLRDPLMHMMRNAIDHGIELPEEREAQGKPRTGTVQLSASQRGGMIDIELRDDGRGLDPAVLRKSAVRKGLFSEEQAAALDDRSALELIYHPGFSTKTAVTETSGRGVGMDVVRQNVEALNGNVAVDSAPGCGTHFTISVPLTLATTRVILVEQGSELFAIPSAMIERNSRVQECQLVNLEGCRAVRIDGHAVPVVELADVLDRPRTGRNGHEDLKWRPFFVLSQGDRRVALLADRLVDEQEIVVKSLGWPLRRVRNVGGASILGSGQTVLILNPSDMLKAAMKLVGSGVRLSPAQTSAPLEERAKRRLLVVDDSITTRTLIRSILTAAGYETSVAADGAEALSLLRSEPIDLVVSDVDMPRMDGFTLTSEVRRDERLRRTPVVLVTSLDAREHRERGVEVGADAYVVKGSFDQGQLLETVNRLL